MNIDDEMKLFEDNINKYTDEEIDAKAKYFQKVLKEELNESDDEQTVVGNDILDLKAKTMKTRKNLKKTGNDILKILKKISDEI